MSLQVIGDRWLANKSVNTARHYHTWLRQFASFRGIPATAESAAQHMLILGETAMRCAIADWKTALFNRGLASGSVAVAVRSIVAIARECRRAGLITWTLDGLCPKVQSRTDMSGPLRVDVEAVMGHVEALAESGDRRAIRDSAIIRLLYVAALNRGAVIGITVEDLRIDDGRGPCILVRRRQLDEQRPTAISYATASAITRLLRILGRARGPLFTRMDKASAGTMKPLTGEGLRRMVEARRKQAGVRRRIRPHGLRHSAIAEIAEHGSPAKLLAISGWKSLHEARIYSNKDRARRDSMSAVELA